MMKARFDSIIFDMDGTLWDAVDSYAAVWNEAIARTGLNRTPVTRDELLRLMGKPLAAILDLLLPGDFDRRNFMEVLGRAEAEMMPTLGGRLYDGVSRLLPMLAKDFRLFMLSNCGENGLPDFLEYTGLGDCFTDCVSYGATHCEKDENLRRLKIKYRLERPLYVGDTQGDADSSHAAGVPIAWAAYGFGTVTDPDYTINRFADLSDIVYQQ